jgi:hypothetical protein
LAGIEPEGSALRVICVTIIMMQSYNRRQPRSTVRLLDGYADHSQHGTPRVQLELRFLPGTLYGKSGPATKLVKRSIRGPWPGVVATLRQRDAASLESLRSSSRTPGSLLSSVKALPQSQSVKMIRPGLWRINLRSVGLMPPEAWGPSVLLLKGDLRNRCDHQAIVQPRLYDCLMLTQVRKSLRVFCGLGPSQM